MKKSLIFVLLLAPFYGALSQRTLDILTPPYAEEPYAITFEDVAYFTYNRSTHFTSFDGVDFVQFDFPEIGSIQLTYDFWKNEMTVLGTALYLRLYNGVEGHLYKFDGRSFTRIPMPGNVVSKPITYQGKIYTLVLVGSEAKLFSYDGGSVVEISGSAIPATSGYNLIVAGEYLYSIGTGYYVYQPSTLKRFNGSTSVVLPSMAFSSGIKNIVSVPGTVEIYIELDNHNIIHYNRSRWRTVYDGSEGNISAFVMWNNVLYFQINAVNSKLYKDNGSVTSEVIFPGSAKPAKGSNVVLYLNKLFIPAELPGNIYQIYTYDGTSFTVNFELPVPLYFPHSFIREGNYAIITKFRNGPTVFEYDGTDYTEINAPDDKHIGNFLTSTSCFYLWNVTHYDPYEYVSEIAKENRECPAVVTIIPEALRNYERIGLYLNGKYRDWCWTDLFWDFKIDPICPIPEICPDPVFGIALSDDYGKEIWEEKFDKPIQIQFPFEDKQAYTLTLSSIQDKSKEALFVFDDDLVKNGIAALDITMLPQKDYFLLTAEADKGKQVPFMMSLLNRNGKTIWQEKFTAPMSQEITAYVDEPGVTLQFSSIPNNINDLKNYGITGISIFPNPSKGKLSVEIESNEEKVPVMLTIADLNGHVLWRNEVMAPGTQNVDLSNQKAGLYILTITVGKARVSEQIKLE